MSSPEVVIFQERFTGKKVNKEPVSESNKKKISTKVKVFNIRKAHNEILKFSLAGFDKESQAKNKIELAVRLGAKPPKRKYINYKELMEEKKQLKLDKEAEHKSKYEMMFKRKKKNVKKKNKDQPSSLF